MKPRFSLCVLCGWLVAAAPLSASGFPAAQTAPTLRRVSAPSPAADNPAADHRTIQKQIDETAHALDALRCPLDPEQQRTASQIRAYLTRAREALRLDDLDGAHTLSTKAHVLLLDLGKVCRHTPAPKGKLTLI